MPSDAIASSFFPPSPRIRPFEWDGRERYQGRLHLQSSKTSEIQLSGSNGLSAELPRYDTISERSGINQSQNGSTVYETHAQISQQDRTTEDQTGSSETEESSDQFPTLDRVSSQVEPQTRHENSLESRPVAAREVFLHPLLGNLVLRYVLLIPDDLSVLWETGLCQHINKLVSETKVVGPTLTQLVLASRNPLAASSLEWMKPTILIHCGDRNQRRRIEKEFENERWIHLRKAMKDLKIRKLTVVNKISYCGGMIGDPNEDEYEYELSGWVTAAQNQASLLQPLDRQSLKSILEEPRALWAANKGGEFAKINFGCSGTIKANSLSQPKYVCFDGFCSHKDSTATIGGIVAIEGKLYGLCVAHAVLKCLPDYKESRPEANEEVLQEGPASDTESTMSEFSSDWESVKEAEDSHIHFKEPKVLHKTTYNVLRPKQIRGKATISALNLGTVAYGRGIRTENATNVIKRSDWSLIDLGLSTVRQSYFPANMHVKQYLTKRELKAGSVHVMLPANGRLRGTMGNTSASLTIGGVEYETRQVVFTEGIENGDSGSWIIQDGGLCGVLIARSATLPYISYMLPAEDVFQNIRYLLGIQNISIPSIDTIRRYNLSISTKTSHPSYDKFEKTPVVNILPLKLSNLPYSTLNFNPVPQLTQIKPNSTLGQKLLEDSDTNDASVPRNNRTQPSFSDVIPEHVDAHDSLGWDDEAHWSDIEDNSNAFRRLISIANAQDIYLQIHWQPSREQRQQPLETQSHVNQMLLSRWREKSRLEQDMHIQLTGAKDKEYLLKREEKIRQQNERDRKYSQELEKTIQQELEYERKYYSEQDLYNQQNRERNQHYSQKQEKRTQQQEERERKYREEMDERVQKQEGRIQQLNQRLEERVEYLKQIKSEDQEYLREREASIRHWAEQGGEDQRNVQQILQQFADQLQQQQKNVSAVASVRKILPDRKFRLQSRRSLEQLISSMLHHGLYSIEL